MVYALVSVRHIWQMRRLRLWIAAYYKNNEDNDNDNSDTSYYYFYYTSSIITIIIMSGSVRWGICIDGRSVCLSVCLSVCGVPDPKSRTEWRRQLKIVKKSAHDPCDSWPLLDVESSNTCRRGGI